MTDNEIIKALECCKPKQNRKCGDCPAYDLGNFCAAELKEKALDLINHQQAEIERLQKEANLVSMQFQDIQERQEETRAEVERLNALLTTKNKLIEGLDLSIGYAYDRAIEEFAEKLKSKVIVDLSCGVDSADYLDDILFKDIDNLVNEMVGEEK